MARNCFILLSQNFQSILEYSLTRFSVNAHHRKLSQTPVSSRDVRLSTLRHQLSEANSAAERAVIQVEIDEELTVRARADKIITNVVSAVNGGT